MRHYRFLPALFVIALVLCSCQTQANRTSAASPDTTAKNGKIPVTTSSDEARKEFLAGRDLSEKLRITDSLAHYDKAISSTRTSRLPNSIVRRLHRVRKSFSNI